MWQPWGNPGSHPNGQFSMWRLYSCVANNIWTSTKVMLYEYVSATLQSHCKVVIQLQLLVKATTENHAKMSSMTFLLWQRQLLMHICRITFVVMVACASIHFTPVMRLTTTAKWQLWCGWQGLLSGYTSKEPKESSNHTSSLVSFQTLLSYFSQHLSSVSIFHTPCANYPSLS